MFVVGSEKMRLVLQVRPGQSFRVNMCVGAFVCLCIRAYMCLCAGLFVHMFTYSHMQCVSALVRTWIPSAHVRISPQKHPCPPSLHHTCTKHTLSSMPSSTFIHMPPTPRLEQSGFCSVQLLCPKIKGLGPEEW